MMSARGEPLHASAHQALTMARRTEMEVEENAVSEVRTALVSEGSSDGAGFIETSSDPSNSLIREEVRMVLMARLRTSSSMQTEV